MVLGARPKSLTDSRKLAHALWTLALVDSTTPVGSDRLKWFAAEVAGWLGDIID